MLYIILCHSQSMQNIKASGMENEAHGVKAISPKSFWAMANELGLWYRTTKCNIQVRLQYPLCKHYFYWAFLCVIIVLSIVGLHVLIKCCNSQHSIYLDGIFCFPPFFTYLTPTNPIYLISIWEIIQSVFADAFKIVY